MEKFNWDKKISVNINNKANIKPEYMKMLNNLLGIGNRDNSVFLSSKVNNFDLNNILSFENQKKIFSNKSFTAVIQDLKSDNDISLLSECQNSEEFIEIIENNGFLMSIADRKLLAINFENSKEEIILKIKRSKNQKIAKWKRFRNKYIDKQAQINSWPLYIGTMFVKVKTTTIPLYAPLILKKVEIQITDKNKVVIKSMDESVDINDKLLFLLQKEYKFNLPTLLVDEKYSLSEVMSEYQKCLEEVNVKNTDPLGKFEFNRKWEIKNQDLQLAPGMTLSILSPSGGNLRDKLIDILNNDDPDKLLDFEVIRDINKEIINEIKNKNTIYRINQTDFSQEKAIHGSLKDNAIVWGPPGTGKSQTISNIIANLMEKESTIIITSEKKAALDVIQKRMGKLAKYMFFGLTDKNIDKKLFYKPFNELVEKLRTMSIQENNRPQTYLNESQWNYLDQKIKLSDENIGSLANTHGYFKRRKSDLFLIINNFNAIKKNTNFFKNIDKKDTLEDAINKANFVKKGIIFKRYPRNVRKTLKISKKLWNDKEIFKDVVDINNVNNLNNINEYVNNEINWSKTSAIFKNDEDALDNIMAHRFMMKIKQLKSDPYIEKKVNTFLKNSVSGFRIPYKFVNIHKEIISKLFDVYVSTPQTLSGIINMNGNYDYSIFDEASQLHLEKAIPFLSITNKSIIAGDHQQMRPTSYFGVRDNTVLTEDSEANVNSLLDFAYRKGLESREYMLTKNYRSKSSDLMLFSSKEFYKGKLDVIDSKSHISKNAIEVFNVKGRWESRINRKEAELALEYLLKNKDKYKKIILLTLNSTQKQHIEALIYSNEEYAEIVDLLKEERVYLRNLENIQGDEADLVIVSVAYDKTAKLGSTYVARPEGKNALNVAISRSIEKMIVFKSISSSEVEGNVKNDSIRVFREWLSYLELSSPERKNYLISTNKNAEEFDSTFEEEVFDILAQNVLLPKKLNMKTQFSVGSYKVDIAIINSKTRKFVLGIEVDGYKYHSGFEKMMKDMERQKFIESKGYKPIYRISELNWKINRRKVLSEINNLLK